MTTLDLDAGAPDRCDVLLVGAGLVGLALALALALAGAYLPEALAHFLLGFLAVQCCLGALLDLFTLVVLSARTSTHSDAINMQHLTGIPAIVWALAWTAVSLVVLAVTLRHFLADATGPGDQVVPS